MQGELGQILEIAKSAGPWSLLTAYLLYKDLYKPWRNGKVNGKTNGKVQSPSSSNGRTAYATEADLSRLAESFREHRTKAEENFSEIRERMVRVETLLESDGHRHGRA